MLLSPCQRNISLSFWGQSRLSLHSWRHRNLLTEEKNHWSVLWEAAQWNSTLFEAQLDIFLWLKKSNISGKKTVGLRTKYSTRVWRKKSHAVHAINKHFQFSSPRREAQWPHLIVIWYYFKIRTRVGELRKVRWDVAHVGVRFSKKFHCISILQTLLGSIQK